MVRCIVQDQTAHRLDPRPDRTSYLGHADEPEQRPGLGRLIGSSVRLQRHAAVEHGRPVLRERQAEADAHVSGVGFDEASAPAIFSSEVIPLLWHKALVWLIIGAGSALRISSRPALLAMTRAVYSAGAHAKHHLPRQTQRIARPAGRKTSRQPLHSVAGEMAGRHV